MAIAPASLVQLGGVKRDERQGTVVRDVLMSILSNPCPFFSSIISLIKCIVLYAKPYIIRVTLNLFEPTL